MSPRGILLVNTGTPEAPTPEAIRPYLQRFLSDKRIVSLPDIIWKPILHGFVLPQRPQKTAEIYRQVWTPAGSPYSLASRSIERKLKRHAANSATARDDRSGEPPLVRMAHRYAEPLMLDALKLFRDHGVHAVTVLPLYPQQAHATTESVRDELQRALDELDYHPQLHFIENYHDHPLYLQALAKNINAALPPAANPATTRLIFSFHSTPLKDRRAGDPYCEQTENSALQIAAVAGLPRALWQVSYQSRFSDGRKWVGPFLKESLDELLAQGVRNFYVIALGFAVDNIETLHEIGHVTAEYVRQQAATHGIGADEVSFTYIPALNDSDAHLKLLAALVV
ncbi:MAG: ferrochelatase [Coriobacteriales bacterium]|nr:ferrochelatase [Coriobacteriales bacterium]